jgi:DNA-binding transcriptional ArsR family regulator
VSTATDDDLWSAIGDPTRRQVLDLLLAVGSGTSTSLSERLPVSRQAVAKHLAVLVRVGLVQGQAAGRERHYRIDDVQFARAVAQLNAVSTAWDGRLRRIKRLAEALQQERGGPSSSRSDTDSADSATPHRRIDA